ncbi:MAG: MraY family glycosyltransferase [Candidatus Gracilibacteria bacterium]|nr:MraY family glycosyltransferase [Candidatus Gracilibacteria bacterium]
MIIQYLTIFIISIFTSLVIILGFKKLFYKLNILDNPKKYGKKREPIPYSMGIVFFIAFFILTSIFVDFNYKLGLIWIFGLFITGISFIDDMLNVSAKIRLLFQIIIGAVIGITSIKIGYISNIFGGISNLETYYFVAFDYTIYYVPIFFTIMWYVFIFNALNWTDGIQGNTSGLSIISFLILFFLGLILFYQDDYEGGIRNAEFIMGISVVLVGIIIPFWWFDVKEKILMGDSGTMFLGFMLATLAIIAGGKVATVLVVFGIYSVDAVYVIIRRLINKKNPLNGDFTHLHHRLQEIGLTREQVLGLVYSLSFLFGLTALFLDKTGKIIVFGVIIVVVIFINKIAEKLLKGKKGKKY